MKKVFTKIARLSVGLALAIGVGVAVGSKEVEAVKAEDAAFMTFDFEDDTAHRTSGSNSYSSTPNVYEENGANITLTYADSITTGTPLSGNASITVRVAANTTNSPSIIVGPIDLSHYYVSGFSYLGKTPAAFTVTASYSTDGTNWTTGETHTSKSSLDTFVSSTLAINEPSAFYIKIVSSVGSSTSSKRDGQFDDIKIIGHSTSTKQLESISCDSQSVDVAKTVDLASQITFTPADAANKNVSFEISGDDHTIDLSASGVVTGVKSGSATVVITPEDTSGGATAINVTITVNAISATTLVVGDQYVVYEPNAKGELSGVSSSLGSVFTYTGEVPSCEYVLTTEDGYFENSVAFKNGSDYLALNSSGNSLNVISGINPNSSWLVTYDSETGAAEIVNAAFQGRSLQYNQNGSNPRFACYALASQTAVNLYHYVEKDLADFSIDATASVYVSGTTQIGVEYDPADASDKELTWTSANEGIATVDDKGLVTGVAVGEVIITASKTIGGNPVERTCTVSVLNNVAAHHGTNADPFNVADAVQVANGIFTKDPDGNPISLENHYYVEGIITLCNQRTPSQLTFWIGDNNTQTSVATGGFQVYRAASVYGIALATAYADDTAVKVDFNRENHVKVYSTLTVYNGTPETTQNVADIVYSDYIEARKYAAAFNAAFEAEGVCDSEGESVVETLASVWSEQSSEYSALDSYVKSILSSATGSTKETATDVEKCAAKYDYIGGKYQTQLGAEYDFMGRNPTAPSSGAINWLENSLADSNTMIIVIAVAAVSALAFTTLLVFKKKKQK